MRKLLGKHLEHDQHLVVHFDFKVTGRCFVAVPLTMLFKRGFKGKHEVVEKGNLVEFSHIWLEGLKDVANAEGVNRPGKYLLHLYDYICRLKIRRF